MSGHTLLKRLLDAEGAALTVGDAESLAAAVARLLGDPDERARRAAAAGRIAAAGGGVLDAVLERFAPWLDAFASPAVEKTTAAPPLIHSEFATANFRPF